MRDELIVRDVICVEAFSVCSLALELAALLGTRDSYILDRVRVVPTIPQALLGVIELRWTCQRC